MLVGRAAEQRRLDEALAGARAGSSETLVLRGEPGIGKTALLEYPAAEAPDFLVVRARGVESEAEIPFAALHELCRPIRGCSPGPHSPRSGSGIPRGWSRRRPRRAPTSAGVRSPRASRSRSSAAGAGKRAGPRARPARARPRVRGRPALRCKGLLAGESAFEEHFERSLELHAADPNLFAAARTRLGYGERLRRSGRRRDARESLRAALDVFERLVAERARAELRATGERLRRREPGAREELTPQELQIALVVAEGKTNREVGAQLYLGPKTVEWHLGHIYRKLGIRSRAELARAVGR